MEKLDSTYSPGKKSRRPQNPSTKTTIDKWLDIYTAHYQHSSKDPEVDAIHRALRHVHPEDLDRAFLTAMQECQYYPRVSDILGRVKVNVERDAGGRQRVDAFIPPRDYGDCYAVSEDGRKMLDSLTRAGVRSERWIKAEQLPTWRCGCHICKPEYWCQVAGCERQAERGQSYCWQHTPSLSQPPEVNQCAT